MNHLRLLEISTDVEYLALFGKTRDELREQFGLPPAKIENDDERDYMGELALETLAGIERRAAEALEAGKFNIASEGQFLAQFTKFIIPDAFYAKVQAVERNEDLLTGESLG